MMAGWAERQLAKARGRNRASLLLVSAPVHDPSVTQGLMGEPLIPRRGGWGARVSRSAPGAANQPASPWGAFEEEAAASAARVRWNLAD